MSRRLSQIPLPYYGALGAWFLVTFLSVGWESKPPFVDIFLFKEAGVRWALEGKFVARNLPHGIPDRDYLYAYYVPVYPFLFGLWSLIFGVSLKASIAFDQGIKALRTVLLFVWLWPILRERWASLRYRSLLHGVFAVWLFALAFFPGYTDRPDDLALVFGLSALIALTRPPARPVLAGFFLGLTGLTSPCAALFFFLLSGLLSFYRLRVWGTAALVFVLGLLPLILADPSVPYRLWAQVPFSTAPLFRLPLSILAHEWYLTFWLAGKWITVPCLLASLLALGLLPRSTSSRWWAPVIVFCLCFLPFASVVWTYQVRYLWFPLCLLLAGVVVLLSEDRRGAVQLAGLGLLLIPLIPQTAIELRGIAQAAQRPAQQREAAVRSGVLDSLTAGKRLAISSDQYFTFRSHREVDMVYYVCRWVERYDAVFVSRRLLDPVTLRPPCHQRRDLFRVASNGDNGGILFRRKGAEHVALDTLAR